MRRFIVKNEQKLKIRPIQPKRDAIEKADEGFPNRGEWKVLQRIIEQIQPLFTATVVNGLGSHKRKVDLKTLERMVRDRNFNGIENIIPFEGLLDPEKLDRIYSGALLQSTEASKKFFQRAIRRIIPTVNPSGFNVNVTNPRVNRYITGKVGSLIRGITRESQISIQSSISSIISDGLTPRSAARVIRDSIGLTPSQVRAVSRFETNLQMQQLAQMTEFQRDSLRLSRRGAKVDNDFLEGLSQERIDRLTSDYANRQLTHRATVIARNELQEVANEGQREVWEQASEAGLIDRNKSKKMWIVTPDERLCDMCSPLQGVEVPFLDNFTIPKTGESKKGPPAHIQCRCALTLIFPEERGIT